jgi:lipopolysaccharide transport system permease protein
MLCMRSFSTRYTQMLFGVAWAAIEPLATVAMMAFVFGVIFKLPSNGVPYPLLVIAGLAPFALFSKALIAGTSSLLENMAVISKVSFPRLILPFSSAFRELFSGITPLFLLLAFQLIYAGTFAWSWLVLPFVLVFAFLFGVGASYWLAALVVPYRDIMYFLGIFVQLMSYLSPVAYSASIVPERLRWIYELNPLYWMIGLTRWSVLGTDIEINGRFFASLTISGLIMIGGLFVFARFERTAVDVQ